MTGSTPEIVLVTPVWNDSRRLAGFGPSLASELARASLPVTWIIADDGSGPEEVAHLEALIPSFLAVYPQVRLHLAPSHLGKGGVVRSAWDSCTNAAWLAFLDADGSVSGKDWVWLMRQAISRQSSVLGIRKRTAETLIEESRYRGIFHRGFLWLAAALLGLRSDDPQCGAKILWGDDYRRAAPFLRETGLAFDSELLAVLSAQNSRWLEIPVSWREAPGGKVRPLRDAWGMFTALLRIRHRRQGSLSQRSG
jgi:dolichyl-phosphate beta-glucosyltransferase